MKAVKESLEKQAKACTEWAERNEQKAQQLATEAATEMASASQRRKLAAEYARLAAEQSDD